MRKRWSKKIGKIIYHKKFTSSDLIKIMMEMGLKKGSVVCIHSSMMQFYNYKGTALEIIESILKEIGPEGRLVMPAFPSKPNIPYEDYIFDPRKDKTDAGYLAEVFRNYPGVNRSNNVHHSVCAIGKYAEYLVKNHIKGHNCWDEFSPRYKMCELNALIFNLGMPRSYMGTFHHCVEGILYKEHPYWSQFFSYRQKYNYLDENGQVITYYQQEGNLIRKTWKKKLLNISLLKSGKLKEFPILK